VTFLPRDERNNLTQEQKDQLISKRRQERMNLNINKTKPFKPKRQLNSHHVAKIGMNNENNDAKALDSTDTLLAHTAGCSSSSVDIRYFLVAKQKSDKGKN
jgi:hypothetical protein